MRFYQLAEIPIRDDDRVFKASSIRAGITLAIVSVITIAFIVLGIFPVPWLDLPRLILFFIAAFFGLFVLLYFHSFRAALKPTNWLLRCNQQGVVIHFRSYQNWRLPPNGPQAVGLDYSEIAWAKTMKERRISPGLGGGNGAQAQQLTFLDFGLANPDTTALEQYLRAEIGFSPEGVMISRDYPVQVRPGGIIELRWTGIHPSSAKAIQYLSQHIKIAATDVRKLNLTHQSKLTPAEEDGKILELIKSGNELGAIKLTRQIYGCSLGDAHERVKKLHSQTQ
ncbi:MAG TPA: hypothetical protein VG347_12865 [Verrucomicrobiae bacterium]|nr:hypothetical protein [Verrucomicrobiae bacterium]